MSARYLMQARSTATGRLVTWLVDGEPDHQGDHFPGPGLPEYVAATRLGSTVGEPKDEAPRSQ